MAARKKDEIYAYARGVFEGNFGHLNIHVHEMFGYGSTTLKISCQTGGLSGQINSYAWEHGLSNDYSVLGLDTLKRGYLAMRRADRLLCAMRNDRGYPETFADYAIRVLQAFGVRRVYVNPRVNGGISGQVTDLPCFSPIKDYDALREALYALESDLVRRAL